MRDIWEKFRRTPPTLSRPDHAAADDEGGAGEGLSPPDHSAAGDEGGAGEGISPPDLAPAGDEGGGDGGEGEKEDLLSALPDDILLLVLLHLPSAAAAARTCVLSRRWSRLWAQLPELRFPLHAERAAAPCVLSRRWSRLWAQLSEVLFPRPSERAVGRPSPVTACAALARHEAPALRLLSIVANDADPRDAAAVLRVAAPRVINVLRFDNVEPEVRKAGVRAAAEMPCFDRAEQLILRLGYLRLVLPPSGVFTKLTMMDLAYVQFTGACDIGNSFSSARCPSLRQLRLVDTQGVSNLAICSESLLRLWLQTVKGLQQLTVVSPMLIELNIFECFFERQPVVDIVAPVMEMIYWVDRYDPISVQLGQMAHLQRLATVCFELTDHQYNWGSLMLLQCFQKIPDLYISICDPHKMVNYQYLMEALTLPPVEELWLSLKTIGHAVVSCIFHFLKIFTSIRRLFLEIHENITEQTACSPGCICHQLQDWKTEELCLNSLEELEICGFSVADCDFSFVKRLLGLTPVLKTVTINFDPSTTLDEDLCKELLGLSGPDTCMKIYLYCDGTKVMYAPVG